jgi:hypothetical protein
MKTNYLALSLLAFALPLTTATANDASQRTAEISTTLTVMGVVPPSCSVGLDTSHPMARPIDQLDLHRSQPQIIAEVNLVCNGGQESVRVMYQSQNGGLMNSTGHIIDYEKMISGVSGSGLASQGAWIVSQDPGPRRHLLRLRPLANSVPLEGRYNDVIQVSVLTD